MLKLIIVMAAAAATVPAAAQTDQAVDQVAYRAIANADYAAAEARLSAQMNQGTREPGVFLNLASIYHRTGRSTDAVALYQRVLEEKNVRMALPDGSPAWSHELAERGIARSRTLAAR